MNVAQMVRNARPARAIPAAGGVVVWWARRRDETRPALHTQDTEQGGDTPDVDRPPDQDVPDFGNDLPDSVRDPGAPPFTGEDVEDTGQPGWRKSPQDEPMGPHATCA